MKNALLILNFIILFCLNAYAQPGIDYNQPTNSGKKFKKGYFINNKGEKTDCLIKDIDWENNPEQFNYKLNEDDATNIKNTSSIKEFEIFGKKKYQRKTFIINLSSEPNSTFEESILLKILVEGKANLYSYEGSDKEMFFFNNDGSQTEQLIYSPSNNSKYIEQLSSSLICDSSSSNNPENLNYKQDDLVDFFVQYNECTNSTFTNYIKVPNKDKFKLTLRPGIKASQLSLGNASSSNRDTDFDIQTGFRFGVETEFVSIYNEKLSYLIEANYQYFNAEKEITYLNTPQFTKSTNVVVEYESIELGVGLRLFSELSSKSKLYYNFTYSLDIPIKGTVLAEREDLINVEIKSRQALSVEIGFRYLNRYNLSLNYLIHRHLLGDTISWKSHYHGMSLIFGYRLF